MKAVKNFIAERGLTVMLCGMGIALTGVIASFVFTQYKVLYANTLFGAIFPPLTVVIVLIGVIVYLIGRISHVKLLRRRAQNKILAESEANND